VPAAAATDRPATAESRRVRRARPLAMIDSTSGGLATDCSQPFNSAIRRSAYRRAEASGTPLRALPTPLLYATLACANFIWQMQERMLWTPLT
jgi:hypothetical protein